MNAVHAVARWVRHANRRRPAEGSMPLRVAVAIAVVASATAVVREGIGGPLLTAAVVVGLPAAFAYSAVTRHRGGLILKAALAVGVIVAFASFVQQLLGGGTLGTVQAPLAQLFLWVQLLHAFDVPARRDLMFSLASSLVLMAMAAVFSTSMALGLHVLVWVPAVIVSLAYAYRSRVGTATALDLTPGASATVSGQATGETPGRLPRRPMIVAGVVVVAAGALVFLVMPQVGAHRGLAFASRLPQQLPVPDLGGLDNPGGDTAPAAPGDGSGGGSGSFGYFGFSTTLDTNLRGRPDDTLVMRVRAARADFWRGQTFDTWDGRHWIQSEAEDDARRLHGSSPLDVPMRQEDGAALIGDEFVQTFMLEEATPNLIFGAYDIRRVHFSDDTLFQMSDGTLRTGVALGRGAVYTVVSSRPPNNAALLRGSDAWFASLQSRDRAAVLPASLRERYTALPEGFPATVADLAASVAEGAATTYDKVLALEAWLAANTRYSLDAPQPAAGMDAAEAFLLHDRVGFCEQIGTALVVMLRSLGIPARLVAGYAPGERNPFTGLFEVKGSDAHAWAEVYFPGTGWQGFDPTASVPLAGESAGSTGSALWPWVNERLPHLPVWTWMAAAAALVAATTGWLLLRRRRRRGRRSAPTWARRQAATIEAIGARGGRARAPNEPLVTYARSLGNPDLTASAEAVERDAFGGGISQARRRETEAALAAVDARQ